MVSELQITPAAPIQSGNLITFRVRFVDEDGAPIDISAASAVTVKLEPPTSGVLVVEITAAFEVDGTDGWIVATYAPVAFGKWRIQGTATIAASTKHTGRGTFPVEPNLS